MDTMKITLTMATYVVGFNEEKDGDYWKSYRHLLSYDPDQVQLLYTSGQRCANSWARHSPIVSTR